MERERIYDEKIAPLMAQILEICKEAGLAMHATFELDIEEDGGLPMTCISHLTGDQGETAMMRMLYAASKCHSNVDRFIWWLKKDAAKYGHSSIELQLMGIPPSENAPPAPGTFAMTVSSKPANT